MNSSDLQQTYFFDLPLSDVYATGCSALRMIYHGSDAGAFGGNTKDSINLEHVKAFQISLKHRSITPLSEKFQYYLVYYRKDLGVNLWSNRFRKGCPTLRRLTRRVKFGSKPSLVPKRVSQFYIKANRPVHIAQYHRRVPTDDNIPLEYVQDFSDHFEGFLMRCKQGFPLVTSVFDAQGLSLCDRRDVYNASAVAPQVRVYSDAVAEEDVVLKDAG